MRRFASNLFARIVNYAYRSFRKVAVESQATSGYSLNSNGAVICGATVEYRSGIDESRFSVGKDSVVSCRVVFERDSGTVSIGSSSYVGGSQIICASGVDIGCNVLISWGCTIVDHDSHSLDWNDRAKDVSAWREGIISGGLGKASELKNWSVVEKAPIRICDKSWLGMNVTVLKGVTIGEGAVVAAGSIVTKDVPAWTLVAGNPARVIKELARP